MRAMHLDKRTSADLDYLKAFAAFLVVLGHCLSYYTAWQPLPLFAGIAEDLIYHVHVPLFFTISGFLCHRQPLRPYYKKKVLRVLVPFWFFAFLKVFFSTAIVRHFAHADTIGGQLYDAFVIGRAYWFAYAIFLMLLIAPLFWEKDEKTAPRKAIIGMIAAAVFSAFCSIKELSLLTEVFQISRTVKHLPFFLSGMVLRYYYPKLKEFFDRRRIPALCLAAAITAASALCFALQLKIDAYLRLLVTSYALMALLLALANALPENCRALAQTGKMSYQIMLLDPFYKVVLFAAAGKLFGGMPLALSAFTPASALLILVYFLLGYALYAVLNSVCGATVSRTEDLNAAMMPTVFISLIAFYAAYLVMFIPNEAAKRVVTYIPFTSPFLLPFRLLNETVPAMDIVISLVLLIICIAVVALLSIRIYSASVLHYGQRLKLKDILRLR